MRVSQNFQKRKSQNKNFFSSPMWSVEKSAQRAQHLVFEPQYTKPFHVSMYYFQRRIPQGENPNKTVKELKEITFEAAQVFDRFFLDDRDAPEEKKALRVKAHFSDYGEISHYTMKFSSGTSSNDPKKAIMAYRFWKESNDAYKETDPAQRKVDRDEYRALTHVACKLAFLDYMLDEEGKTKHGVMSYGLHRMDKNDREPVFFVQVKKDALLPRLGKLHLDCPLALKAVPDCSIARKGKAICYYNSNAAIIVSVHVEDAEGDRMELGGPSPLPMDSFVSESLGSQKGETGCDIAAIGKQEAVFQGRKPA